MKQDLNDYECLRGIATSLPGQVDGVKDVAARALADAATQAAQIHNAKFVAARVIVEVWIDRGD